jgi:hypothetical protein
MGVIIADKNQYWLFFTNKKLNKNYALLALLVFSLGLPASTFVFFFSTTGELVLSASLAIAAGMESTATFRSESALLFLRRLRLDSASVSMMLSNCAAASEDLGTGVGVLRAI